MPWDASPFTIKGVARVRLWIGAPWDWRGCRASVLPVCGLGFPPPCNQTAARGADRRPNGSGRRVFPGGDDRPGGLAWGRKGPGPSEPARLTSVTLSEIDRNLLQRCLQRKPRAWEDFVDRFMGLVVHVVNHTAQAKSVRLSAEDRDDLCAEVFMRLVQDDFAILSRFRGQCSLATYLTVIARRIIVKKILQRKSMARLGEGVTAADPGLARPVEDRVADEEEVQRLLKNLDGTEAQVVRMYHLEGKSYYEISVAVGLSENSIGPMLSRARGKMRSAGVG